MIPYGMSEVTRSNNNPLTMSVRNKYLLYLAHPHRAFLQLVLCGFSTIKKPDISPQLQR